MNKEVVMKNKTLWVGIKKGLNIQKIKKFNVKKNWKKIQKIKKKKENRFILRRLSVQSKIKGSNKWRRLIKSTKRERRNS